VVDAVQGGGTLGSRGRDDRREAGAHVGDGDLGALELRQIDYYLGEIGSFKESLFSYRVHGSNYTLESFNEYLNVFFDGFNCHVQD
jgi:hypothetical protein